MHATYLHYLLHVIILFIGTSCDCGCELNRAAQCSESGSNENKYSKESNSKQIDFDPAEMALIPSGTFTMGTDKPVFEQDFEAPAREIFLDSFYMDKYEVSNEEFQKFVDATDYHTEAEHFGDSFVFEHHIPKDQLHKYDDFRAVQAPWWIKMDNVDWAHPEGPQSHIKDRLNHPVTHVSWSDAVAFCKYKGKRLPTEAEWEYSCRGGLQGKLYPWGNLLNAKGLHWTNILQGHFPETDTGEDGWIGTCPVDAFPSNKYGLFNMAGNVWEWTQDNWQASEEMKVKKGGSFLCHESYCWRYRCAARSQNTKDSSSSNLGFRCAANIEN